LALTSLAIAIGQRRCLAVERLNAKPAPIAGLEVKQGAFGKMTLEDESEGGPLLELADLLLDIRAQARIGDLAREMLDSGHSDKR
jgi:hypothetical protein